MSANWPTWITDAMVQVKMLCPPDAEPTLTDDEYANAIIVTQFPSHPDDPPTTTPRANHQGAAHDCWLLKAGKASGDYAFSEAGLSDHPEQVVAHCLQMALAVSDHGIA